MAIRPGQKIPNNIDEIDGLTKCAILLLTLDYEAAGAMLRQLPGEMVEDVTRTLASLDEVPGEIIAQVIEEFYNLRMASQYMKEGGLDFAQRLLKDSLDPRVAEKVIQQIQTQVQQTPVQLPAEGREREPPDVHPG
jgi:flagellar motor switch protein FliG